MSYYNPYSHHPEHYNTDRYFMLGQQIQLRHPMFKSRPMWQPERRMLPPQRHLLGPPLRQPRPLTQASKDQHALEHRLRPQAPRDDNSHVKKLREPISNKKQEEAATYQQLRQPKLQEPSAKTQSSPKEQPPPKPPAVTKSQDQLNEPIQKPQEQTNDEEKLTEILDMDKELGDVLSGVKKRVPRREWRRRLNLHLWRALRPQPALAALNEMLPNQMQEGLLKVETPWRVEANALGPPEFSAEFSVNGRRYEGHGRSKTAARNFAAEQAFREIVIERMVKMEKGEAEAAGEDESQGGAERPLPIVQLASYALHKLFAQWQREGYKVPELQDLGPLPEPEDCEWEPRGVRSRALPADAAAMNPCALLALLRPQARYADVSDADGARARVRIDGFTFVSSATSKRKARKLAARAACTKLFGVKFDKEEDE